MSLIHILTGNESDLVDNSGGPARGRGGGSRVTGLSFKTSRVGVYKCLSLIVGFAVTVAMWPREVVSCCDFILHSVATFWAMSLVGIYPGRVSSRCNSLTLLILNPHYPHTNSPN